MLLRAGGTPVFMASVTLEKVTKRFGDVTAVNAVDLEVADQEFVVLVGPSGCGKSTTLRMIAGLEEVSSGTIRIGGRVVNDLPPKERDIAMVFQNYALYPHMTVYDNMAFALRLRRRPQAEIDRRIREVAEMLDIGHLLRRKPRELSGGEQQRVALGRAIVREPQVFLMDEPLSNLDAKMRVQMRAEIGRLHRRLKTTTLYVTHDQVEAMTMADRVVVMKDGVIQQVATPQEIYNLPANKFVAGFIGSPPMNFIDGALVREGGLLWFRAGSLGLAVSREHVSSLEAKGEDAVTLGVRPEALRPAKVGDPPHAVLSAVVEMVEPLGSEVVVYLSASPGISLVSRFNPGARAKPGDRINLYVDMRQAHFFSRQTERTITSPPPVAS
jgi:multiple sugar transport system ATP-binding protein